MDLKEVECKDVNLKRLIQVCVRGLDITDVEYLGSTTRHLVTSETFLKLIREQLFSLLFCCSSTNTLYKVFKNLQIDFSGRGKIFQRKK
jgi:hypothetical protein